MSFSKFSRRADGRRGRTGCNWVGLLGLLFWVCPVLGLLLLIGYSADGVGGGVGANSSYKPIFLTYPIYSVPIWYLRIRIGVDTICSLIVRRATRGLASLPIAETVATTSSIQCRGLSSRHVHCPSVVASPP